MDKRDEKNLKRRYLIWLYKTTKESLDRYERRFTQLDIDQFMLQEIEKKLKGSFLPHEKKALEAYVNEFRSYIADKEKVNLQIKYKGKKINPEFIFLDVKLEVIEKAIIKELGKDKLEEIKAAHDKEMLRRIMEYRTEQRP